jgi:beta-lactamase regulating signal transducer with metallopeptidase domain
MEHFFQQAWVMRIGWTLIHFLWQGAAIAVFTALALALGGGRLSSANRYALLCTALCAMIAAPLITCATLGAAGAAALPAQAGRFAATAWTHALPWLVTAWLSGVALFTFRLLSGWRRATRMRGAAEGPIPAEWLRIFNELISRMSVSAPVRVLASSFVTAPVVIGWLRPVILMPVEVLAGAPLEHVRALLAHELAHILRHDYAVNVLQSIAEAVLFYHPAVWWISARIRTERECCCDDIAVAISGDVVIYVSSLAALEQRRKSRLQSALAADGGSVVSRVRRLLDETHGVSHELPGPATLVLSLLWLVAAGSAALQAAPTLPSDRTPEPAGLKRPAPIAVLPPSPEPRKPVRAGASHIAMAALLYDPFFQPPGPQQQNPSPSLDEQQNKKQARVEGTVISVSGAPLKKAKVSLRLPATGAPVSEGPTTFSELTDDSGKFVIDDLPPGSYTLTAARAGFVTGTYGAAAPGGSGTPLTLAEGARLTDIEIKLTPQGVVSGKLTDEDGEPRKQSQVCLVNPELARREALNQVNIRSGHCAQANDIGAFTIGEVPPGRYYLAALPVGSSPYLEPGTKDVTTYYPNVAAAASAAAIEVAAGSRLDGMNIQLRRERQLRQIKGKILVGGAPASGTIMLLFTPAASGLRRAGEDPASKFRAVEAQNGTFQISDVAPGLYTLRSVPSGMIAAAAIMGLSIGYGGSLDISVKDENIEGAVLRLEPGIEVEGSVRFEDGGALSARPAMAFTPADESAAGAPMPLQPDGTFRSMPLAAGGYRLNVMGLPDGSYVKSATYGSQDVTQSLINVVSGGGRLEIVVSPKAAAVTGSLRNEKGEPASRILVTAWPRSPNPGRSDRGVRTASTDQSGSFRIGGLAPGEYYVAAWEDIDAAVARDLGFLSAFTSQAVTLDLRESSVRRADVKMVPKDRIAEEAGRLR